MATVNPTGTGRYTNRFAVRAVFTSFTVAAVTSAPLNYFVMPCDGRITAVDAWALTSGTVGGTTTLDLMVATGTTSTTFATIYTTTANRPVINNLTTTGSFVTAGLPDLPMLRKGDILRLDAVVSANTGPAGVAVSVVIGMP